MQRAPMSYLQTDFLKSVVNCGLLSIKLEHRYMWNLTLLFQKIADSELSIYITVCAVMFKRVHPYDVH